MDADLMIWKFDNLVMEYRWWMSRVTLKGMNCSWINESETVCMLTGVVRIWMRNGVYGYGSVCVYESATLRMLAGWLRIWVRVCAYKSSGQCVYQSGGVRIPIRSTAYTNAKHRVYRCETQRIPMRNGLQANFAVLYLNRVLSVWVWGKTEIPVEAANYLNLN